MYNTPRPPSHHDQLSLTKLLGRTVHLEKGRTGPLKHATLALPCPPTISRGQIEALSIAHQSWTMSPATRSRQSNGRSWQPIVRLA
jgi:hypothetical protein